MIKTVIFDLGGVLLDLDMERCFRNVRDLGIDMENLSRLSTTDELGEGSIICEGVKATGVMHQYQLGKVPTDAFISGLAQMARPGTSFQQALDAWNSCLLTIPVYKLDFVRELRDRGYHVYMLSNTNDAHWKYIEKTCFPKPTGYYFDKLFLSQELGLAKPDERIYREVLSQTGMTADECLFIDDSKANCIAAEELGIHTYNTPVRTDFRETVNRLLHQL